MQDEGLGPGAGHRDEIILPHLDAAYNLAHWLVRNRVGAGDVVYDWMQRYASPLRGLRCQPDDLKQFVQLLQH
jgi:hypothetical protein